MIFLNDIEHLFGAICLADANVSFPPTRRGLIVIVFQRKVDVAQSVQSSRAYWRNNRNFVALIYNHFLIRTAIFEHVDIFQINRNKTAL